MWFRSNRKKLLWATVITVAVTAGIWGVLSKTFLSKPKDDADAGPYHPFNISGISKPVVPESMRVAMEGRKASISALIKRKKSASIAAEEERVQMQELTKIYRALHESQNMFFSETLRKESFKNLAEDKVAISNAIKLVSDPASFSVDLGKDLALARVYNIKFLAYLASEGRVEPLQKAIADLANTLDNRGETVKEQSEDLVALVQNAIAHNSGDSLFRDDESLFKAIGHSPAANKDNLSLADRSVATGIVLAMRDRVGVKTIQEFLQRNYPQMLSTQMTQKDGEGL